MRSNSFLSFGLSSYKSYFCFFVFFVFLFLSLELFITALLNFFEVKGAWFSLIFLLFIGECLSYTIQNLLTCHTGYLFIPIHSSFAKFKIKFIEEIIFIKVFKILLFNIFLFFKISSAECEYHLVIITEVRLESGSVMKTP